MNTFLSWLVQNNVELVRTPNPIASIVVLINCRRINCRTLAGLFLTGPSDYPVLNLTSVVTDGTDSYVASLFNASSLYIF